ncbi:MAG: ABC transporter substrate-binding protein [Fusobacteriota bacterium]
MKKYLISLIMIINGFSLLGSDLNIYTSLAPSLAKKLFTEFEEQSNLDVEWRRYSTNETVDIIKNEKENPWASIWVGGVGLGHIELKNNNLSLKYNPFFAKNIPARFQDEEGYWIGLYIGPLVIGTNRNLADKKNIEIPNGWKDLLKDEFKDNISVANPNKSGTAYNFITTILDINKGDEEKTFEYLENIDKNISYYTSSGSKPGKDCAKGKVITSIGYLHDYLKRIEEGGNIEITFPEEGTGYEIASMSILKGGKNTENAKKLYNWLITKKAQNLMVKELNVISLSQFMNQDNGSKYTFSNIETVNQDLKWDVENKERLLKIWNEKIGKHNSEKRD